MNATPLLPAPRVLLVGIDAEGLGDHAIHAGLELERAFGSKLVLVHAVGTAALDWEVVEDPRDAARNTGILTRATQAIYEHVRKLLAARDQASRRVEDLVRVVIGPPARVLLEQARELDADVILLGTHKRRGWVDFGSTVRAVLAQAPKAVWLQTSPLVRIQSVLCPVDLSKESLQALEHARNLARIWNARLDAVHVFQSSQFMLSTWPEYPDFGAAFALEDLRKAARAEFQRALEAFDWQGVPHQVLFQDGEPVERVLELAHTRDLVVMGTHGRTGFASALLGNVAYGVMKRCEKPVLAIRHPEREFLT